VHRLSSICSGFLRVVTWDGQEIRIPAEDHVPGDKKGDGCHGHRGSSGNRSCHRENAENSIGSAEVLSGMEIDARGSSEIPEFFDRVQKARVFAWVTPVQKLAIVDALIRMGHFVAVTGDGVNDAPALRRAHIGVAMGSGTDIVMDYSSMIITDDRFSSIVAGIEGGWYAFEPGEKGAMSRPPRPPSQGIFNRLMISQILVSSVVMAMIGFAAWHFMIPSGIEEHTARNLAVLLFVLLENVHVFNCRSEYVSAFRMPLSRNVVLVGSVIGAQIVHQVAMHIPVL